MLKKVNRLRSVGIRAKNKISTPLFNLAISESSLDQSRFSFVISKKTDKRSVVRNRTKRKIRSIVEEMLDKISNGKDFTFYLKKETIVAKRNDIRSMINQVFEKNNLLK